MKKYILITLLFFITSISAIGQELPTIGEVFDFQVGDEFHYDNGYYWPGSLLISYEKIITVDYSIDSNEVTYTIIREHYQIWDWDWDWNDSIIDPPNQVDTLDVEYTNLDSSMFFYDDIFLNDTVLYLAENFCSAEIYGAHYYFDGSEGPGIRIKEWGIGLGLTYRYFSGWTGSSERILMYFLKNGVECTLQEVNVGIETPLYPKSISVFPTLFTDFITIESDSKDELTLCIYSLSGQEISNQKINSSSVQVDLSFVPSGNYIFVIRSRKDNQVIKTGKLIKS